MSPLPRQAGTAARAGLVAGGLVAGGLVTAAGMPAAVGLVAAPSAGATPRSGIRAAHVPAPDPARPTSASSCNRSVCIYLVGSGTNVSSWATNAWSYSYVCTYANFSANGTPIAQSNTLCGSHQSFLVTWYHPGYFAPYTQLCNTWAGIPGRACETIIP